MKIRNYLMLLFSINTNPDLARAIARLAHLKLGRLEIKTFADGELYVRLKDKVRGQVVWVFGSTMPPTDNLVKLLILLNALKTSGAKKINLIIPYFSYGRQDHIDQPGAPLTAKLMADLIAAAGASRIVVIDLHSQKIADFFKIPAVHLNAIPLFAKYFKKIKKLVVISPDKGGEKRAATLSKLLHASTITLSKTRPRPNVVAKIILPDGVDIQNKNIVIIDDLIDTAGTICQAAKLLKKHGAKNIYAAAAHGVFSGPAISRIKKSPIKQVLITDTFPLPPQKKLKKIKIISVAPIISKSLRGV